MQDLAIIEAQRRGSATMLVRSLAFRSFTALRSGELHLAEDLAQRALELAREVGHLALTVIWTAGIFLERGRARQAAELLRQVELDESLLDVWPGVALLAERGRIRVALGDLEPGLHDLLDADRRMHDGGCHLSVFTDWVPDAALALTRLGRSSQASELAGRELADAAAFGAPRRHGIAVSLCGLLDPGEQGLARLREAVAVLECSSARLAHARALVNLGTGLRVRGQREQAREPLSRALDIAHRLGAAVLAEQTRDELIATGARPRRNAITGRDALTASELRVARLAAQGLANREIAQALFITTRTAKVHLGRAYRKLQITRRDQLASALSGLPGSTTGAGGDREDFLEPPAAKD